jgi:hypothetical protein
LQYGEIGKAAERWTLGFGQYRLYFEGNCETLVKGVIARGLGGFSLRMVNFDS